MNSVKGTVYTPRGKNKTAELVKSIIGNANYHVEKICSILKANAYNPWGKSIKYIERIIDVYWQENIKQRYQYFTKE